MTVILVPHRTAIRMVSDGRDLTERDQARFSGTKATSFDVETLEVRFEIDMQPFAACLFRFPGRERHHLGSKPFTAFFTRDHRIEQERMHAAVPCDIDEADQAVRTPQANPAQAVAVDLLPPILRQHRMTKGLRMKRVQLVIAERAAPLGDHICQAFITR